jgi:hypothetical protein
MAMALAIFFQTGAVAGCKRLRHCSQNRPNQERVKSQPSQPCSVTPPVFDGPGPCGIGTAIRSMLLNVHADYYFRNSAPFFNRDFHDDNQPAYRPI